MIPKNMNIVLDKQLEHIREFEKDVRIGIMRIMMTYITNIKMNMLL